MRIPFTKEGYAKIKKEYEDLIKKRPEAVNELRTAREMGDLSENGYYKAARAKLSSIDSRLRHLSNLINFGRVITINFNGKVDFGCTVIIKNVDEKSQKTYMITGKYESNPLEGKISIESPIGKALLGKTRRDIVQITIPRGKATYRIIDVIAPK